MLQIWAQSSQYSSPNALVPTPPADAIPPEGSMQDPDISFPPADITLPTTPEEAEALNKILYPEAQSIDESVAEAIPTKWSVRPRVTASVMFDNNILLSSNNRQSDIVFTLMPGITIGRGDFESRKANYLLLDYAPSAVMYANHPEHDAIDHDANLGIQLLAGRFTFALNGRFLDITGPNTDIGRFTTWQVYDTDLLTKYDIAEKTFAEIDLHNRVINYQDGLDSVEWTARSWWNYRCSPKLLFGAGLSGGQLDVQGSGSQTYLQPLLKTAYTASEKLSVEGSGGIDIRWFGSAAGERVNPVWAVGAVYLPMEATEVRFDTYRRIEGAASIIGTDYTVTGISIQVSHKIQERYELIFTTGYERSDYNNITSLPTVSRHDNYFYVRPSLRATLSEKFNAGVFCQYRSNVSNPDVYKFENVQAGVSFGYAY